VPFHELERGDLIIHPLPVKRGEAWFGVLRALKDADRESL
jgi:hypothetical protein